ncbi:hypothetical protein [Bacillus sp. 03113]|uniref:hypothetical protein n=1 Tax=Bacillus sp. 03113 TaxID=2578211 RepID=UPI0015E8A8E7|nr:hypothetical protein [Bacillus sp. 03113]
MKNKEFKGKVNLLDDQGINQVTEQIMDSYNSGVVDQSVFQSENGKQYEEEQ